VEPRFKCNLFDKRETQRSVFVVDARRVMCVCVMLSLVQLLESEISVDYARRWTTDGGSTCHINLSTGASLQRLDNQCISSRQ